MPFNFSPVALIASLFFSLVGGIVLNASRKEGHLPGVLVGAALIAYAYFFDDALWIIVIGVLLCGAAWLTRPE